MNALTVLAEVEEVVTPGYDPGITPNFNAPWMPSLQNVGGMIFATAIALLAIVLVIGAVVWVAGKLGAGGRAQETGLSVLGWGVVAAVIIGSVGGIISWATGIPLFA